MSKEYIEIDILDVMSVIEGSYTNANRRWDELKKLIELQKLQPTPRAADECWAVRETHLSSSWKFCPHCGASISTHR